MGLALFLKFFWTEERLYTCYPPTINLVRVILVYVPGCSGVDGNEEADKLARIKSAADSTNSSQIPIQSQYHNQFFKCYQKLVACATSYSGGEHTERFFSAPTQKWSRGLLLLKKNNISRVVTTITRHCVLNKHNITMGLSQDPMCSCGLVDETGLHVISDAQSLPLWEKIILGDCILSPSEILKLGPILFLTGTNRFI